MTLMPKYSVTATKKFRKSIKLARKRGLDLSLIENVVENLMRDVELEERYRDHALKGEFVGLRECHIQADWLLIYKKDKELVLLTLIDTGTHADLLNI